MSREIDMENLSEEDVLYLQQRGQLPDDYDPVETDLHVPLDVTEQANTGDANTAGRSPEQFEKQVVAEQAKQYESSEPAQASEDEDVDYTSLSNDQLRAELSTRGLSVEGRKADLIQRLEDDDASDESDEDETEEEE